MSLPVIWPVRVGRIRTREIRDGNAIYYIGEFGVANEETLKFDVQARPQGPTKGRGPV